MQSSLVPFLQTGSRFSELGAVGLSTAHNSGNTSRSTSPLVPDPCQEGGLVSCEQNTVGKTIWHLTDLGRSSVCPCWKLTAPKHILQDGDLGDVFNMTKYQLLLALQKAGWSMRVVSSRQELQRVRQLEYKAGDHERVWYLKMDQGLADIKTPYLQVLLLADQHMKPVPHLAALERYKQILDPDYQPQVRKRRMRWHAEGDDFEALQLDVSGVALEDRKRPKRQRRRLPPTQMLTDAAAPAPLLDEPMAEAEGDDTSGSGGTSDDNLPEVSLEGMPTELPGSEPAAAPPALETRPAPDVDATHENSSDSSSSSSTSESKDATSQRSSSSNSSSSSSSPDPRADKRPERRPLPQAITRTRERTVQFGLCYMTPRFKNGEASGFQMSCTQAEHNTHRKCTKEVSFGVFRAACPPHAQGLAHLWRVRVNARRTHGRGVEKHCANAEGWNLARRS